MDAAITVRTVPELELLQAVRSKRFSRVEVTLKDGLIRHLDGEGTGQANDLEVQESAFKVVVMAEFKRPSKAARKARNVRVRPTLPRKYAVSDNEPVLFACRLPAKHS